MTALGLFIWCLGAGILAGRLFSFGMKYPLRVVWSTITLNWSNKRKWIELALILIGSTLILVGTVLQIMGVQ